MSQHTISRIVLTLALATLGMGCGDELPTQSSVIGGIVRTDATGAILSDDDPSDWLPRSTGGSSGGGSVSTARTQGLRPAFPNPATASSSIDFVIERSCIVRADVTDDEGDVIAVLIDTDTLEAGEHVHSWNLTDASGAALPNGMYRVRFTFEPGSFISPGYWRKSGEKWTSHGDIEIAR